MTMQNLIRFVNPPLKPKETGSIDQWRETQEKLGTDLPPDYRKYIEVFGTGKFCDFIYPFNPFAASPYSNLINRLDEQHLAEREMKLNFPNTRNSIVEPFSLFPASDGLLPWGTTTDAGDFLYWMVKGNPKHWTIVLYNLRYGDYWHFDSTFTEFLAGIFSGDCLPQTFPTSLAQNSSDREIIVFDNSYVEN